MEKIPKPVRVITGDQHKVQKTIDDFFVSTKNYLMGKVRGELKDFEIRLEKVYKEKGSIPDDRLHLLLYKEGVVALVMETRTQFNWVQYDFFRNLDNFSE